MVSSALRVRIYIYIYIYMFFVHPIWSFDLTEINT